MLPPQIHRIVVIGRHRTLNTLSQPATDLVVAPVRLICSVSVAEGKARRLLDMQMFAPTDCGEGKAVVATRKLSGTRSINALSPHQYYGVKST